MVDAGLLSSGGTGPGFRASHVLSWSAETPPLGAFRRDAERGQKRLGLGKRGVVMPVRKLKQYLDEQHIKYVTLQHSTAYTAQEIAASAHIPGRMLAKTVMVKLDREMAMVVLPSSLRVDFALLKKASGAQQAELASEEEFKDMFPECEPGAMPPFGNLYGMAVYGATALDREPEIAFNAGSHKELIRMRYADFLRLVKPKMFPLSTREMEVAAH
jgi:Ala-tRNA(Pro) deacylase